MSSPANLFADVLARFEATGASAAVTHYVLSLGAQNGTTGCYAESYAAGATIHMMIFTKATQRFLQGTGISVRRDAMGLTDTAVSEGDKVKDANNLYYRVTAVKPHPWGNISVFYEVDLTYNPYHQL